MDQILPVFFKKNRFIAWFPNILRIISNYGRWSEMVAAKLPNVLPGSITFENISIKLLACKNTEVQIPEFKKQWLGQTFLQQCERFLKIGSMHSDLKQGHNNMTSLLSPK